MPQLEDPQQEDSPVKEPSVEDPLVKEPKAAAQQLQLSAVERELLDYHAIVSRRLATPLPNSLAGISLFQIRGLLEVASQKNCLALYLLDSIHLLHSAFMIGTEVYACTSKGGINSDNYVKFKQSEFMSPMVGLSDPSYSSGNADLARRIPTTRDLLAAEDVSSFAQLHTLHEVHSQEVAIQTARPPAIILLSGELYHSQTSLCLDFQLAVYCQHGTLCKQNHRSCKGIVKRRDEPMIKKAKEVDVLAIAIFQ